jgi:hypothetical protein
VVSMCIVRIGEDVVRVIWLSGSYIHNN